MNERYIEKSFLVLLACSLLLHLGAFLLLLSLPVEKKSELTEPLMVDLQDLPEIEAPQKPVAKSLPRALPKERFKQKDALESKQLMPPPSAQEAAKLKDKTKEIVGDKRSTEHIEKRRDELPSERTGADLFKYREQKSRESAQLSLSPKKLDSLEESYRKKYSANIGGDTQFLDENNSLMGSFNRRFLEALNSRWRQIGAQLIRNGQLGYGLVLITISRDGKVEDVKVVESSGNHSVDEAAVNAAKSTDYVGPLPKKWPYEKVHGYYIYTAGYEVR